MEYVLIAQLVGEETSEQVQLMQQGVTPGCIQVYNSFGPNSSQSTLKKCTLAISKHKRGYKAQQKTALASR